MPCCVWPSGTVAGLCAESGFELSMTWKDRILVSATIKSKYAERAKVRYGEKVVELDMKAGETIYLDAKLNRIK